MNASKEMKRKTSLVVAMVNVLVPSIAKCDALGMAICESQMQAYQDGMRDGMLAIATEVLSGDGIGDALTGEERNTLAAQLSGVAAGVAEWTPAPWASK